MYGPECEQNNNCCEAKVRTKMESIAFLVALAFLESQNSEIHCGIQSPVAGRQSPVANHCRVGQKESSGCVGLFNGNDCSNCKSGW